MQIGLDFEKARDYIVSKLTNELSPKLTYHRVEHTVNEVAPAAERLAKLENIDKEERLLLLTAVYFHDAGFIHKREGHEAASIQIAEQVLPDYGYAQDHLAVIISIIKATRIPQSPTNLLEKIIADADLDYLGKDSFWVRSGDLRNELENFGPKFTDLDWYLYQIRFIQAHRYFTESQRSLRDAQKKQHLLEIQKKLQQVRSN